MGDGVYSRLGAWVQRRRGTIIAGYAVATLLFGWLSTRITLAPDITDLLPEDAPAAADMRLYLARFGTLDRLFISLRDDGQGPDDRLEEAAENLAASLSAQGAITDVRWGFASEDLVTMGRRAMQHLPVLVPSPSAGALRGRVSPAGTRAALERLGRGATLAAGFGIPLKEMAAEDPLGLLEFVALPASGGPAPVQPDPASGLFMSADGRSLLMVATPARPPTDVEFSERLLSGLDLAIDGLLADYPGLHADHAGGHLFAVQDAGRIRRDMITTTCISMSAIVLLYAAAMRRIGVLLILCVPLSVSMIWTLGIAAIYPGRLNMVSIGFAAVLLGMGDDALTHLYTRFREELAGGANRAAAAAAALAGSARPMVVATLTTGAAFGTLAFVRFRGLAELGIIAAIGLINLLVCALLLFPAMLGAGSGRASPVPPVSLPVRPFVTLHRWMMRRRRLALACGLLLGLGAALASTRLTFSSDLAALRGTDEAALRLARVLAPFGALAEPMHIITETGSVEEALRAAEAAAPLCERLREEGFITGYSYPGSWLPSEAAQRERAAALAGIDWNLVEKTLVETASSLGMREGYFAPFLAHARRYADFESIRIRPGASDPAIPGLDGTTAAITLIPAPGRSIPEVASRARRIAAGLGLPPLRIASPALVTEELSHVIEADFRSAALLALVAVAAIAWAAFRSASRLLLGMLPVAMGCLLMLGVMAALGIPINLMSLIAVPIVVGLGIDFGVYLISRHVETGGNDAARALEQTGGAMLLTGATTITGFGSLLAAQFAGLRSIGLAAVIGIAGALLSALTLLPLLLPGRRDAP